MTNLGQLLSPNRKAPRHPGSKWSRFKKNVFVSFLIDLVVIVGSALVLSLLIKTFLIRSFFVPSGSMLETLQIDDRILVNELVPNLIPIQRGDVVVFKDPGGWLGTVSTEPQTPVAAVTDWFLSSFGLTAPDSSQHLVKRVIGVGGDHVVCCDADGKLTINGKAINETYIAQDAKPSDKTFDVVVPEGSIWVMGDNRPNSEDSRFHGDLPSKGFVGEQFIVGRAFVITWPVEHWIWLDNFSDVFKDVPNP
ncbi:MAG: signal peptidase I [Rhodoluna sp.]|jgi:signal peptidase I|nr:signal peptidase I [Rhodoluna sp.]MBP7819194.1 signal peptidase I [Rhodoluna sp.]